MKEIKTSKGIVKYQDPNPINALRLMGKVRKKIDINASEEEWIAETVDQMDFLFDLKEAKCNYDDLKNDSESARFLIDVASDFIVKMTELYKKKQSLETQSMSTQKV